MRNFKSLFLVFAVFALVILGCKKDGNKASWDVDLLAPLLYTELTISDIIPDSLLTNNADGFVSLAYADTIIRLELDTLVKLPDTTITEIFSLPFGQIDVPPGTQFSSIPDEIEINAQGIELKTALVKVGTITINITSTAPGPIICKYDIPDAQLNGVPFHAESQVPGMVNNTPGETTITFDVSGYSLDFTQGLTSSFNRLKTLLTLGTDPSGATLTLNPTHIITIKTTFSDFRPKFATGYFGSQSYDVGPESSDLNFFNLIESGTIDIDQVQFNLLLRNGIGADIRATIHQFSSVNSSTNSEINLQNSIIGMPINLNRATYNNNQINYGEYPIILNNLNSNIDEMLEDFPNQINYAASLLLNPLGNISNHNDFVDCESTFDVVLDAEIPLSIIANQLQLGDTSNFSIAGDDIFDNVNYGTLVIRMNNGFPLEGWLNFSLLIQNEESISLLDDAYFPSASLDPNNIVLAPTFKEFRIELSAEDISKLRESDKLVARVRFNTANLTEHIRIYDYYAMSLKAIGDFNYYVETK